MATPPSAYAGQPLPGTGGRGRGICGRWNDICSCEGRVLEYTCYYSTISPTTYALPLPSSTAGAGTHAQGPLTRWLPGATSSQEMLYPSASSSLSPDTHDFNEVPTNIFPFPFYPTSLYHQAAAIEILTPAILPPTTTSAASSSRITKTTTTKTMRNCGTISAPRCTRFKHSSCLRDYEGDSLASGSMANAGGWFLQRLIEVATTGSAPASGSGVLVAREIPTTEQRGMDVDVDRVSEELRKLRTADVEVVQEEEGAVLAISRTLEGLSVSNRPVSAPSNTTTKTSPTSSPPPVSASASAFSLPSNPASASPSSSSSSSTRITIPPYAPIITTTTPSPTSAPSAPSPPSTPPPLSHSATTTPTNSPPHSKSPLHPAPAPITYYPSPSSPSSPGLATTARRYLPSAAAHSYPAYKSLPASLREAGGLMGLPALKSKGGSGAGAGAGCLIRRDRGKERERERERAGVAGDRVYSGAYTWSGYSSDGSYDHATSSSSTPGYPYGYGYGLPSSSSSSSKVHTGRVGKRRTGSAGSSGGGTCGISGVGAERGAGTAAGGVLIVMGVRRLGRRGPSPGRVGVGMGMDLGKIEVLQKMGMGLGGMVVERKDSGVGMMEMDDDGDGREGMGMGMGGMGMGMGGMGGYAGGEEGDRNGDADVCMVMDEDYDYDF